MNENELINNDIHAYLEQHQNKELLRFVTVGSVDDGKSTLIGRLLHDTHGIYEDQLNAVKRASSRAGLDIDFSLFTDGLKAEREQGITIDVAYRYFSTSRRKFIIADTPGHVQYTRNMATGASTANVAIILIDARLGVLQQSRRHAYIAALLGIPHLAVCINKMDLEGYREDVFLRIREDFQSFAGKLGFKEITFIPVSALKGDNIVHRSGSTPWYAGKTLLEHLETVPVTADVNHQNFRFPVQIVLRPDLDYRGFSGTIASGSVKKGDPISVLSSGKTSRVLAIDTYGGELESAHAPMSVTLRLTDEIDISRGDMLAHPDDLPKSARRFDAMLVWMNERPLDRQKSYLLKHTTRVVRADVEHVAYTTDLETLDERPATRLELNDIGRVTIACHRPLYCDAYTKNRGTGAFILIDSLTNDTVAAGMILPLDEAGAPSGETSKPGQARSQVSPAERRERWKQSGATVWLTGLPGVGKTQIAYALERRLFDLKRFALVSDPADGLGSETTEGGASPKASKELALRASNAGLIAIFAHASPRKGEREAVREAVSNERFLEVHVTSARSSAPFSEEAPEAPALSVSLDQEEPERAAERIVRALLERGLVQPL